MEDMRGQPNGTIRSDRTMRFIWVFVVLSVYIQFSENTEIEAKQNDALFDSEEKHNINDKSGRRIRRYGDGTKVKHFIRILAKSNAAPKSAKEDELIQKTQDFITDIATKYEAAGWGPMFPGPIDTWIKSLDVSETGAMNLNWPLAAIKVVMATASKAFTLIKTYWVFFLIPLVLILVLKFAQPYIS